MVRKAADPFSEFMNKSSIIHTDLRKLVNAGNLSEKKNLLTAKDFVGVLVFRRLGASKTTAHARSKQ